MIVTIPAKTEHEGYASATYEISDNCPVCGEPRGEIFGAYSYDGSRRLNVDSWRNKCGHIDKYSNVRKEGKRVAYKEPTTLQMCALIGQKGNNNDTR
jgi:hypothetical protein